MRAFGSQPARGVFLPLVALDASEVACLVQAGDDERLFRTIFLAQRDELAGCMPAVFEHIGSAMELLRPDEDHETGFRRIASPEEITVCDPACGSGHILVMYTGR